MNIAKTDIEEVAVLTFTTGLGCWDVDEMEAFAHALDRLYEVFQIVTISRSDQVAGSTSAQFDLVTGLSGYRMGRVPSLKYLVDFLWPEKLPCKRLCIDHIDMQSMHKSAWNSDNLLQGRLLRRIDSGKPRLVQKKSIDSHIFIFIRGLCILVLNQPKSFKRLKLDIRERILSHVHGFDIAGLAIPFDQWHFSIGV